MEQPNSGSERLHDRKIFLSFRSRDDHQVAGLTTLLNSLGNSVIQMGEFPSGRWKKTIYKSVAEADTLLVFLSRDPEPGWPRRMVDAMIKPLAPMLERVRNFFIERGFLNEAPIDWMKEEFNHFIITHPEKQDVVIYKEEDAVLPEHLSDFQAHPFSSDLTKIRQKWHQLLKDGVPRAKAREIVIEDLKVRGIKLESRAEAQFFDTFGVVGIASATRWIKLRMRRMWQQSSRGATILFILLALPYLAFHVGWSSHDARIPEPTLTQIAIEVGQSGNLACSKANLVCVSVSQSQVRFKNDDGSSSGYGYFTPSCTSKMQRAYESQDQCKTEWGNSYKITDVYLEKHPESNLPFTRTGVEFVCQPESTYRHANCANPIPFDR